MCLGISNEMDMILDLYDVYPYMHRWEHINKTSTFYIIQAIQTICFISIFSTIGLAL